jgi:hypothetical protein
MKHKESRLGDLMWNTLFPVTVSGIGQPTSARGYLEKNCPDMITFL